MFKLFFHVGNNEDGSVGVDFHKTKREAIYAEENEPIPWAESSVSCLNLKIIKNKIYRQESYWDTKKDRWEHRWIPLEEAS